MQRQRVTGVFGVRDVSSDPYDLLDARKVDYNQMTEDFFSTLKNPAVYGKAPKKRSSRREGKSENSAAFPLNVGANDSDFVLVLEVLRK